MIIDITVVNLSFFNNSIMAIVAIVIIDGNRRSIVDYDLFIPPNNSENLQHMHLCSVRDDVTRCDDVTSCHVRSTYGREYIEYAVMSQDVRSVLRTDGGRYLYHVLRGTL